MEKRHRVQILIGVFSLLLALLLLYATYSLLRTWLSRRRAAAESPEDGGEISKLEAEAEGMVGFAGGEDLTAHDVLEAPGEVVGKSSYGTLYRASLERTGALALLRFVRPASAVRPGEVLTAARAMGIVRHPNLVPLCALYIGPRGEKLFVHPFYSAGTLAQFLRDEHTESYRWEFIYKLSLGIARGLDHLHNGLKKPIVHGNLKTNNVLLDANHQPRLSDFGMHLLLNPTVGKEMLEASAAQGYKAPELIKMKDASMESDIYSLGVIFFEIVTRKEVMNVRTLVLDNKFRELLLSQIIHQNSGKEEVFVMYFQLAMACCSPSPASRPDIKHVVRKLEEIGR